MLKLLLAYLVGIFIGGLVMYLAVSKYKSGELIVTQDEDGEYLFLNLDVPVSYISQKQYALFRITRK